MERGRDRGRRGEGGGDALHNIGTHITTKKKKMIRHKKGLCLDIMWSTFICG
ncbi:hypothetical protein DCAR_0102348 [Daucus carota subsp. sativus]|uniref:Uncharacterized protein n=1 Tax=Daucus carota subsp. sativus TaxID=79200 RepID=A0AAF1AGP8_DAUCS|nr:hypothetical protein DCAR_0102348 [Daucus carota subsp. sativus]